MEERKKDDMRKDGGKVERKEGKRKDGGER